jgi:putative sterol carrier protein
LVARQQNPASPVLTGKINVKGDMAAAAKLRTLFG